MNLSDPTQSIIPTLDGPVLAVLVAAGQPLTVGQVARRAARGSEIGIRRAMTRLVDQGIVRATLVGRNQVHEINRNHLAAEAAIALAGLRQELWRRFRAEFAGWSVIPALAVAFGSAARGDGNTRSDIDLLLVHPAFAQEEGSTGSSERIQPHGLEELEGFPSGRDEGLVHKWQEQLDDLRDKVLEWTGNRLQVVDLSDVEFLRACQERQALMRHVERDGIQLMAPAVGLTWQSGEISWLDPSAPALPRRQMPFDGSG